MNNKIVIGGIMVSVPVTVAVILAPWKIILITALLLTFIVGIIMLAESL